MKKKEKNAILEWAKGLSNEELEKEYYDLVFSSLGSEAEEMYERGYDMRDIKEREELEKYLGEKTDILGQLCEERGIKLWEDEKPAEREDVITSDEFKDLLQLLEGYKPDFVAQPNYSCFPTLEEIKRDYCELMELIKDIRTPEQAKAFADSKGIIVEINGERVEDFMRDPLSDGVDIEWIRYESFGCLLYIYDRFDGKPRFDVWSNAMNREFIEYMNIDELSDGVYKTWVSDEIEHLLELGEIPCNVDALIADAVDKSMGTCNNIGDKSDVVLVKE